MQRQSQFRRNEKLEKLLSELEQDFECSEGALRDRYSAIGVKHPLIFVFGPMRSGTTLYMQWLASLDCFAYPSNLLSRFYYAPLMGAKIHQLLTNPEFSFRDELNDLSPAARFESSNGKTAGSLSPNEFGYFWNRHIKYGERDYADNQLLEKTVDKSRLVGEFAGLTSIFDKPFAIKALKHNFNVSFLSSLFNKAIFVRIHRDPASNVASVIDARKRQFGSVDPWYSFKVPEYESLVKLPPMDQVVGQVESINRALDAGFSIIPEHRKVDVCYEKFCENPSAAYKELADKVNGFGAYLPDSYEGEASFAVTRTINPDRSSFNSSLKRLQSLNVFSEY